MSLGLEAQQRILHSYLFVPGNRPERFAKAWATEADAVIVDLEDAVPPQERALARSALDAWLSPSRPVLVRINGAGTEWFPDDVACCAKAGVSGIVLPKTERVEDILLVGDHTAADISILPLIETAQGFWNALPLARTPRVQRLVFGPLDLQLDLGMDAEEDELLHFRSTLVLASRLAGLQPPVDGVTTAIDDPDRLRTDTLRSKRLGFGAKLCIHPKQVSIVNACFAPTAEEEAWARRVMKAATASSGAAVTLDGRMVDRPIVARAQAILASIKQQRRMPTK
jgi:citrate lyase subunit beta/citryl-CoA lyase